ncbi:MAG TPA: TPM domain-containing protein [Polyangia bacterium]|nr:TPM domain-containing protein [Polyangia bacterium]
MVTQASSKLVQGIDVARVEAAVAAAERLTSGEVRVAISRFYFWGDVRRAANATFTRLHMGRTRHRNAVLVFVAPRRRRFAVVGDVGIHARVADSFWREVARDLQASFKGGDLTVGLERAVATIGERLAAHFPPDPGAGNELSNRVVSGRR